MLIWLLTALPVAVPAQTAAEVPLSAIDWLSRSVTAPGAIPPLAGAQAGEPPVATSALPGEVSTRSLDGPSLDALGLLPVAASGLPRDLWGATPTTELARMLRAERVETLPAIQSLLLTLLLAELDPPEDRADDGSLYLARIDKLLDLGALDPALALLELAGEPQPEPFRRWFDIALLTGQEDRACAVMRDSPRIAPTFPARIFCLARGGDWNAAALSLRTGETLGYIEPAMADLLARFLDPELTEGEPDLPMPDRPSPLVLRLMEAIGQPMTTTTLPLAFAHADLSANAGWKTRLDAAERLARTGAIDPNRLWGLYTERRAAASGGVWDRVRAVQAVDAAIAAGERTAVMAALQPAWDAMVAVELEVPFANLHGETLAGMGLTGAPGALAFRIGLLSDGYAAVAAGRRAEGPDEAFLIGLARGNPAAGFPDDQLGVAIRAAFRPDAPLASDFADLLGQRRMGEALLRAIDHVTEGARGDLRDVTAGLAFLRHVGLDVVARRAALELLLLERRG